MLGPTSLYALILPRVNKGIIIITIIHYHYYYYYHYHYQCHWKSRAHKTGSLACSNSQSRHGINFNLPARRSSCIINLLLLDIQETLNHSDITPFMLLESLCDTENLRATKDHTRYYRGENNTQSTVLWKLSTTKKNSNLPPGKYSNHLFDIGEMFPLIVHKYTGHTSHNSRWVPLLKADSNNDSQQRLPKHSGAV